MTKQYVWDSSSVASFWDDVSHSHLDDLSFAKLNGQKLFDLVRNWLPENSSILDFGAGSGYLVRILLDNHYYVSAFDPSEGRESTLSDSVGDHSGFLGLENGATDRRYDAVILSEVIEHLLDADYELVLNRVSQFVKPGGVLIVTTPNAEDVEAKKVVCPGCRHFFHPWQHLRSFTPMTLQHEFTVRAFDKVFMGLVDFSDSALEFELSQVVKDLKIKLDQPQPVARIAGFRSLFAYLKRFLVGDNLANELREQINRCHQKADFYQSASAISIDAEREIDFCFGNQSTIVFVARRRCD